MAFTGQQLLPKRAPLYLVGGIVAFLLISSFPLLFPRQPFTSYGKLTVQEVIDFEIQTGVIGTTGEGEYFPRWVQEWPKPALTLPPRLDEASLPPGASAEVVSDDRFREEFHVDAGRPFDVVANTIYFPGWRAYVDEKPVGITPTKGKGLISFSIPAGRHRVELKFEDTPLRKWAGIGSLVSLVLLFLLAASTAIKQRLERSQGEAKRGQTNEERPSLLPSVALTLFVLAVAFSFWGFLPHKGRFTYELRPVARAQHQTFVNFGNRLALIGYDLQPEGTYLKPGDDIHFVLYWEAIEPPEEDWSILVQLMKTNGQYQVIGQDDAQNPGNIGTHIWPVGRYVRDKHQLRMPKDAPPGTYTIEVGVYSQTGAMLRLPLISEGKETTSDSLGLADYYIPPTPISAGWIPVKSSYRLNDGISLVGYGITPSQAAGGRAIQVDLYWRAERHLGENLTVTTQALDDRGVIVGQKDAIPLGGGYPTNVWKQGLTFQDRYVIPLTADVPSGSPLQILTALYDASTMTRSIAVDSHGSRQRDDAILLAKIAAP